MEEFDARTLQDTEILGIYDAIRVDFHIEALLRIPQFFFFYVTQKSTTLDVNEYIY